MASGSSNGDDEPTYTDSEVTAIIANRIPIEQVKGMLMYIWGVSADEAFDMLRLKSRTTNIKLRLLVEQILADPLQARTRWDDHR